MIRALILALAVLPATAQARDITVFAAASLTDALTRAAAAYEARTGDHAVLAFAGSSALARQIEQGAPADLFVSANEAWMDALETGGMIDSASRIDLLGNTLVLIAHGTAEPVTLDATLDLPGLLNGGHLAMALVQAVPAGIYGKAALESLGLWDRVEPMVAQTDNVRAALALVATGEAPLGITYATDALADPRVHVIGTFPPGTHPAITYPAAVTAQAAQPQAARDFLTWLQTPEARAIFVAQGFTTP